MKKIPRKCISFFLAGLLSLASNAFAQVISISPDDTLYFGLIPEEKTAVRNVSIFNFSATSLTVSELRVEGSNAADFSIIDAPGSTTLGLLQKLVLDVQFKPASEGNSSAQLVVVSNAATSPDKIDLYGTGTDLNDGFITFERIFGRTDGDGASSVRVTDDGGFIVAGSTQLIEREFRDATLIKLDAYGQVLWSKEYGVEKWSESFSEAIPTNDGGFIAVGSKSNSDDALPPDVWIIKTDAAGTLMWEKTFGDKETDSAADVIQTDAGGYLIVGGFEHDTAQRQDTDAYLIKLDTGGNLIWEKQWGGDGGERAGSVRQTADGYIVVGTTTSFGVSEQDAYLLKLDNDGNEQWFKTYGSTDFEVGRKVLLTDDGGYLFAGWTSSFGAQARDVYLVKTDAQGNELWHKLFGGEHKDEAADIIPANGGYLIVGNFENTFFSNNWRTDLYIIRTDGSGNEIWNRKYGDFDDEGASGVRGLDDGGFIICGGANSYGNDGEVYLLKINDQGNVTSVFANADLIPNRFFLAQNFPNPFNAGTTIEYHLPKATHVRLDIYNLRGQNVLTLVDEFKQSGYHTVHFEGNGLASGLYFYQIKSADFAGIRRMLLLK